MSTWRASLLTDSPRPPKTVYFFSRDKKTTRAGQTGSPACWRGRSHCAPYCLGLNVITRSTRQSNSDPWGGGPLSSVLVQWFRASFLLLLYLGWGVQRLLLPHLDPHLPPPPSPGPHFWRHLCKHSCVVDFKACHSFEHPRDIERSAAPPTLLLLSKNTDVYASKQKTAIKVVSAPLKGNMISLKLRCNKSHCDLASTNKDERHHWERAGQFAHCVCYW